MKTTLKNFKEHNQTGTVFLRSLLCLVLSVFAMGIVSAQAPSHDPSTMIRNIDGRYWIFTTGDGPWAMSASNPDFTDWRPEVTPFAPGTYPGWINNYVSGFQGFFWAPDIIKIGNTYFLYYSCAGNGAPAAIGLATASDLRGPWTDRGMVVAGNNAIDPALYLDNGRLWMSWGNWQSGIDIIELSTSSGKPISGTTHLVDGQVEGPGLIKNGNYYYLFYQRGLCCNGLSSSYYMVVARSTSITGPYTGERTFLPNRSGNEHGPGHFGYGEGRLTYHYYAVNDNGAARLRTTTLGWSNGWPVAGGSGGWSSGGGIGSFYQLRNRGTGLYLDGLGRTNNGDDCAQWGNTTHPNSRWEFVDVGNGYTQLRNVGTGLYLDGMGRTNNGAAVGQWPNTTHPNSHWAVQQFDGNYYRIRNRNTGLYLDGMGRAGNGDACGQWGNTSHPNAQWQLIPTSNGRIDNILTDEDISETPTAVMPYPNPMQDVLHFDLKTDHEFTSARIIDLTGKLVREESLLAENNSMDVSDLKTGTYFLELVSPSEVKRMKLLKQ